MTDATRAAAERRLKHEIERMTPLARAIVRLERGQSAANVRRAYPHITTRVVHDTMYVKDEKRRLTAAYKDGRGELSGAVGDSIVLGLNPAGYRVIFDAALARARSEEVLDRHAAVPRRPDLPSEVRNLIYKHISDKYKLRRMAEVNSAAKRRLDDIKKREKRRRMFHKMFVHPLRRLNKDDPRRKMILGAWTTRLIPGMRIVRRILAGQVIPPGRYGDVRVRAFARGPVLVMYILEIQKHHIRMEIVNDHGVWTPWRVHLIDHLRGLVRILRPQPDGTFTIDPHEPLMLQDPSDLRVLLGEAYARAWAATSH